MAAMSIQAFKPKRRLKRKEWTKNHHKTTKQNETTKSKIRRQKAKSDDKKQNETTKSKMRRKKAK